MKTHLISVPASAHHHPPAGHPERAERYDAVLAGARTSGVEISSWTGSAERTALERVHIPAHVDAIMASVPASGTVSLDADTHMGPGSLNAAFEGAGAAIAAVDQVLDTDIEAVFVAARPPGHHAEPDRAMGFCLFNNVAIAAMHAIEARGLDSAAVVDVDVHHGNGTQAFAEDEPRLSFTSLHQGWIYPGTGAAHEVGTHGNILNVVFEKGTGPELWLERFDAQVLPKLERDRPEILLASVGFDAHVDDPLAGLRLDDAAYGDIATRLARAARDFSHSRLVCVLEGGYDCAALERSTQTFLEALQAG